MSSVTQFYTFHQIAESMSNNAPHALVQQEWARLERVVRQFGLIHGADPRANISRLIDKYLVKHPLVTPELVRELHAMRTLRNRCAHGEAPPLSVEESSAFAYRAWDITSALAWGKAEFLSQSSRPH
jgi:hypothetical protein